MKGGTPTLQRALIISGSFNVLFLTLFFYWLVEEPKQEIYQASKSTTSPYRFDKLQELKERSFNELVELLKSEEKVDGAYLVRDYALAALSHYHDFDIEKALGSRPFHRSLSSVKFYPGVTDEQFSLLYKFGREELSPLTFRGLFQRLRAEPRSEKLQKALFVREEYRTLEKQLLNTPGFETREQIIALMLEGDEALIGSFLHYEGVTREVILQRFLAFGSKIAEKLVVAPVKKVEIALSDEPKKSDARPKAQLQVRKEPQRVGQEEKERFHTVVTGDTLWKISRRYGCTVDKLRKLNHLKNDALKPGKILKVPG